MSSRDLHPPTNSMRPKPGFYYHYKRKDAWKGAGEPPINYYAYYICRVGCHTEDDCRPRDQFTMIYRPLYPDAFVYQHNMDDVRPLEMFYELATNKAGERVVRFQHITDVETIAQLNHIRLAMYPEEYAAEIVLRELMAHLKHEALLKRLNIGSVKISDHPDSLWSRALKVVGRDPDVLDYEMSALRERFVAGA